jgi:hypothetical protein
MPASYGLEDPGSTTGIHAGPRNLSFLKGSGSQPAIYLMVTGKYSSWIMWTDFESNYSSHFLNYSYVFMVFKAANYSSHLYFLL